MSIASASSLLGLHARAQATGAAPRPDRAPLRRPHARRLGCCCCCRRLSEGSRSTAGSRAGADSAFTFSAASSPASPSAASSSARGASSPSLSKSSPPKTSTTRTLRAPCSGTCGTCRAPRPLLELQHILRFRIDTAPSATPAQLARQQAIEWVASIASCARASGRCQLFCRLVRRGRVVGRRVPLANLIPCQSLRSLRRREQF